MKDISFQNQVAIVTGAGRSLGRSYALELARRGAAVVVADIGGAAGEPAWADAVVAEIVGGGGRAVASQASVAEPAGGHAIVEAALSHFGTVDIVINNAGFIRSAMFEDMTLDQLHDVMNVHLLGTFYVTQPAWRIMKKKGYGRVVLTSSGSTFGMQANSNYMAAKAGLHGLVRALALEGESCGVKVNTVMPFAVSRISVDNPLIGPDIPHFRSKINEMGDRRTPESVAALVVYLASRACEISGESFSALAGRYARVLPAVTKGWICDDLDRLSAEDIGDHFSQICDTSSLTMPSSMVDEVVTVIDQLKNGQ